MSIASRIETIEGHIEQAYDELQGLGADLTGIDKNIENISIVLDDIYDSMPQVSGEGTSLTLDDTRVGKIKSTLKGNTSQTTYSGKNLLPNDTETKTRNGITITKNSDGTYKINGTATSDVSEAICNSFIPMSGTWRMLGCPSGGSASTYMLSAYVGYWGEGSPNIDTGNGTNITYTGNVKVRFYIKSGTTCNNLIFKPMLTTDTSTTINDFEPYVGGTASPNPSYPQPVNVVSGDNEINVCGKNLFIPTLKVDDANISVTRCTVSLSGDEYTFSATGNDMYFGNIVPTGTSYQNIFGTLYDVEGVSNLVFKPTNTDFDKNFVCYYDKNKVSLGYVQINNSTGLITPVVNTKYIGFRIGKGSSVSGTSYSTKFQLEKGSSASTYEPYQGNTYNIDLPVENLLPISSLASTTSNGITFTNNNDGTYTLNGTATAEATFYIFGGNTEIKANSKLTFSCKELIEGTRIFWYDNWAIISGAEQRIGSGKPNYTTTNEITTISQLRVNISVVSGTTVNNLTIKPMLEKGSKANSYTPYGTTPIELCKIGNYQDYFYKNSDKWYLHKEIGKVVLNGSESGWHTSSLSVTGYKSYYVDSNVRINQDVSGSKCNYFEYKTYNDWQSLLQATFIENTYQAIGIRVAETLAPTLEDFKTWLSTHNTIAYFVLATPTNTEVEYQPLIDQLNLLEKAQSKENQTNISQVNNDLPFIISASALKEWQESTSLNSTLSMANPLSLGNTLNTQENDIQPIEVDNIEPLEEEENEES